MLKLALIKNSGHDERAIVGFKSTPSIGLPILLIDWNLPARIGRGKRSQQWGKARMDFEDHTSVPGRMLRVHLWRIRILPRGHIRKVGDN